MLLLNRSAREVELASVPPSLRDSILPSRNGGRRRLPADVVEELHRLGPLLRVELAVAVLVEQAEGEPLAGGRVGRAEQAQGAGYWWRDRGSAATGPRGCGECTCRGALGQVL